MESIMSYNSETKNTELIPKTEEEILEEKYKGTFREEIEKALVNYQSKPTLCEIRIIATVKHMYVVPGSKLGDAADSNNLEKVLNCHKKLY